MKSRLHGLRNNRTITSGSISRRERMERQTIGGREREEIGDRKGKEER